MTHTQQLEELITSLQLHIISVNAVISGYTKGLCTMLDQHATTILAKYNPVTISQ